MPYHRTDRHSRRWHLPVGVLVGRKLPIEQGEEQDGDEGDAGGQPEAPIITSPLLDDHPVES